MPAWNKFADALLAAANSMAELMEGMHKQMMQSGAAASLPEKLDHHAKMSAGHLASLQAIKAALEPLYASFSDEALRLVQRRTEEVRGRAKDRPHGRDVIGAGVRPRPRQVMSRKSWSHRPSSSGSIRGRSRSRQTYRDYYDTGARNAVFPCQAASRSGPTRRPHRRRHRSRRTAGLIGIARLTRKPSQQSSVKFRATGADMANLSKAVCHVELDQGRFGRVRPGNLRESARPRASRHGDEPHRPRPLTCSPGRS